MPGHMTSTSWLGERQLAETGKVGSMYGWTDLNALARRLNS
jgi:hypothetical protein